MLNILLTLMYSSQFLTPLSFFTWLFSQVLLINFPLIRSIKLQYFFVLFLLHVYPAIGHHLLWQVCDEGERCLHLTCVTHKHAGTATPSRNEKDSMGENSSSEVKPVELPEDINSASPTEAADTVLQTNREKTLKDAVKPKHKRKNKASFASGSQMNFCQKRYSMYVMTQFAGQNLSSLECRE